MFTMKRMSALTFEQALEVWNRGFEGYMVNVSMTMDRWIARFGMEGISPEMSIVAFDGDTPVGFVVNAVKKVQGKVVAWNGGTGVIPEYRRRGVGRVLMNETLRLYRDAGVQYATLEAIQGNDRAIALYQQMGYDIVDELVFYHQGESWHPQAFETQANASQIVHGMPFELEQLSFYKPYEAWQTQWQNVKDGGCYIAVDAQGEAIGYALYKHSYDTTTKQLHRYLLQCDTITGRSDAPDIVKSLLKAVFLPSRVDCQRGTINLSKKNSIVLDVLETAGFLVRAEQVYMTKNMEGAD